jgi:hypothetical protein
MPDNGWPRLEGTVETVLAKKSKLLAILKTADGVQLWLDGGGT